MNHQFKLKQQIKILMLNEDFVNHERIVGNDLN